MASSRVDKYEKRRKNTKRLSLLLILAGVLVIVLLGFLFFGGDSESHESNESGTAEQTSDDSPSDTEKDPADDESESEKQSTGENPDSKSDDENENEKQEREQLKSFDDNVIKAYTSDWEPVGTEQTGSHTTNYDDGSQDRQEMRKAAAAATDLNESDLIMWCAERNDNQNDDQKVINTVSDSDKDDIYRVYNKWVANEGWQPTKVEKLKENDKKQ
ncbi:hypothetical protein GCM10028778_08850 [Barrientosiimonas marina]|uniref:DUF1510 family protein n=1 Tax=Lentibacillus kimchii TaxID=1542911 RepID=A0ABW2UVW9_9BACI